MMKCDICGGEVDRAICKSCDSELTNDAFGDLQQENVRLREALKPFAEYGNDGCWPLDIYSDDHGITQVVSPDATTTVIILGDFRRAHAALDPK